MTPTSESVQVTRHATPRAFYASAGTMLESAETENLLVIGLSFGAYDQEKQNDDTYLATIERRGEVVAAALMLSTSSLFLSFDSEAYLPHLVDDLTERSIHPPSVHGTMSNSGTFARLWSERTSLPHRRSGSQRLYRVEHVLPPPDVPGRFRQATQDDLDLVAEWVWRFIEDTGQHGERSSVPEAARRRIDLGQIYLWEDGETVSMAGWAGRTPNGVRINSVYTPPELRGQGYASACVAALSQQLLDTGKRYCFLFTDIFNPTSNSIYQKIGYMPVCDYAVYAF